MASVPMDSILEELRCLDGELFKSELTQRLYLLLKTQATDSLRTVWNVGKTAGGVYAKALSFYTAWTSNLRDEEMRRLRLHRDVDELWLQVAMLYVKLAHRTTAQHVVRIKTPSLEDLVQNFFGLLVKSPWCINGELWSYDAVRLDFALRELFRQAVMASVQISETAPPPSAPSPRRAHASFRRPEPEDDQSTVFPDDSVSQFLEARPRRQERTPSPEPRKRTPSPEDERDRTPEKDRTPSPPRSSSPESDDAPPRQSKSRSPARSVVFRDGGRTDDGATVVLRTSRSDARTVAGDRRRDDASTVSGSTRSSGSSRFSRLAAPRVMTLSTAPRLGAIEETAIHTSVEIGDGDGDSEASGERAITIELPSGKE